ncbi:hypothetical protein [Mucilaginibacter psychrotolerans]|uniref:Lipoprotein n=1 Tax=Mucilaginibacter psychrotolerans TaxID=1524096 RepID=A0A4Y8SLK2_9SPHI|nr:hypothetical protein [Mucilaginibacter psychrotolerans]TFF39585.1 hypothetical protein E2R66_04220 [Mucilaginibacter psychrotolerans]
MARNIFILSVFAIALVAACNNNTSKPKPVSNTLSKTAITLNGKKDSVINNPDKNYGNATIAEPCVKCLITAVKADENYKKVVKTEKDIKFVVNYVKNLQIGGEDINQAKATNALRVDVIDKIPAQHRVATYIYDNSVAKLYLLAKNTPIELKTDTILLKKIRNGCYWGVVSGK